MRNQGRERGGAFLYVWNRIVVFLFYFILFYSFIRSYMKANRPLQYQIDLNEWYNLSKVLRGTREKPRKLNGCHGNKRSKCACQKKKKKKFNPTPLVVSYYHGDNCAWDLKKKKIGPPLPTQHHHATVTKKKKKKKL